MRNVRECSSVSFRANVFGTKVFLLLERVGGQYQFLRIVNDVTEQAGFLNPGDSVALFSTMNAETEQITASLMGLSIPERLERYIVKYVK